MSQQHSAMSITQLINEEMDPDVKMAVEALGDMSRSKVHITLPPLSTSSTTTTSPLPTPTNTSAQHPSYPPENKFIYRVSNIPLVNSALKVYENSKNSSQVVKYGAQMVESFAAPIYDKFGKQALSNVDEWGCKQLDKLEEKYPTYVGSKRKEEDYEDYYQDEDDAHSTVSAFARTSLIDDHEIRKRNSSRSTSPHKPYNKSSSRHHHHHHHHHPIAPHSRWHRIVLHASSAAGTTAAVISEESMKCLKYCLSWLQYASQHIEQQMNLLRRYLVSSTDHQAVIHQQPDNTLSKIKKEIVDTLRKLVEVISKYAGTGLPEQAKASVRSFILALPSRWAILHSKTTSPATSPALKPTDITQETSIKLLNFGGESIEMIQSVAHVFSDTIDRAELWLNRLSVVSGSQKKSENQPMDLN
ncbi:hypothetical protein G6F29_004159 [Rhizopus arrhizus]|nr:hypothetical protein G6F23_008421 [Rhizopus arrhizus]KAG0767154.1 hypothetical protein G6F24_003024 [Rhizopus arrhizus]KAG0790015.1 hypothetical protein G6F22_006536 [Rhizopus arrhizus]KAG0912816.1 hypothetical protein G6F33_005735 [Rhizopus arrhizus]KAG0939269.1 hypothetical protein G6F30_007344 [Rhizopus arrhizus]